MGICSSCLGGRRASDSEQSDTSHLLSDPYHQHHYGSISASAAHGGPQPDQEEIRRQRDTLERICAQASDKLIDVSQTTHTDHGSRMTSEYPRLFNERFPASRPSSADANRDGHQDEATWLENIIRHTDEDEGGWERVQPIDSGALIIQFGEATGPEKRR